MSVHVSTFYSKLNMKSAFITDGFIVKNSFANAKCLKTEFRMNTQIKSPHPESLDALNQKDWQLYKERELQSILPRNVAVITTLNPDNPERQVNAMQNWKKLKFPVFALNIKSEFEKVAGDYPWIVFEEPSKTAEQIVGKPFVLFDSFLDWFSKHQEFTHIVILNSDVLVPTSSVFWKSAVELANDSLLFGSRVNTDEPNATRDTIYHLGFDFFVLSRNLISSYPSSEFCVGAPFWDYWVPFVPLQQGIPCIFAHGEFAQHVWHEDNWVPEWYVYFGREFVSQTARLGLKILERENESGTSQPDHQEIVDFSYAVLSLIYQGSNIVALD